MNVTDGADIRGAHEVKADFAVVGSGPAGAAAARVLSAGGTRVVVVEAGPLRTPDQFHEDGFHAMADLYRDLGGSLTSGRAPMPLVQAEVVGGTSVVNGAICWRLPRDVYDAWVAADPGLGEALSWADLEAATDEIWRDLQIAPTEPHIAGRKNELMAAAADALGLEHRPIRRNVRGCEGLGRCMQGCPAGHKLSMERGYLPDACAHGATILSAARAERVDLARGRATGISGRTAGGGAFRVHAGRVVLAASAIGTPRLLLRSGLRQGPVGRHFSCHPGLAVAGRFREPVHPWRGATQGHEVIGLRREGLKFEALGYDLAVLATRLPGVGSNLAAALDDAAHQVHWGAALKASALGRVSRARVRYELTPDDMRLARRGARVLGDLLLAAGAQRVDLGVHGWPSDLSDPSELARFEREGPLDPRAWHFAATHLFGTCRAATGPEDGVVRPDLRHHQVEGLYVVDSSVFPGNTGVNPQVAIMAVATVAARGMLAR